jgi:hypothetical protein
MRLPPSPAAQFQATKTRALYSVSNSFFRPTVRIAELHLTRYHPAFIPRAADEPPAPPVAQLSEPEIVVQITARAARATEL